MRRLIDRLFCKLFGHSSKVWCVIEPMGVIQQHSHTCSLCLTTYMTEIRWAPDVTARTMADMGLSVSDQSANYLH